LPTSIRSFETVFLLAPGNRVMARMLMPSQRRWRILARPSFESLFILTLMLDKAHGAYTVLGVVDENRC
jgi:hypothetical protein